MKTPRLDRVLGTASLRVLAWLGRRASARGDIHESVHCDAAVLVGHSTHTEGWPCSMSEINRVLVNAKRQASPGSDT